LHFGLGRSADAQTDLAAFDALASKPADLVALVEQYGLRSAISGATGTK
jgi:hypothetical protein